MNLFFRRLKEPRLWKRVVYERMTEPLHLNILALFVSLFGTFRLKVAFDLIIRRHIAWGLLKAADQAKAQGLSRIQCIEFGVATGAGLLNMCDIARKVTSITGVEFLVVGFDTGLGMPPAKGYRDHPDLYQQGDYPMDFEALKKRLPKNADLILGDISKTVPEFLNSRLGENMPVGFVVVDVDYYSSTVAALKLFEGEATDYLPVSLIYLDDIALDPHNPFAGELLAVKEFNDRNEFRKICRPEFLEFERLYTRVKWLKHIFYLHVMDHPLRNTTSKGNQRVIDNPYLG